MFIKPGSPWENGYMEPFIGKSKDELLSGKIFVTLLEERIVIECWADNTINSGRTVLWDTNLLLHRLMIMELQLCMCNNKGGQVIKKGSHIFLA